MFATKETTDFFLDQLGITRWVLRRPPENSELVLLAQKVSQCTRCTLHSTRTQTVFARGNPQAQLMIIGEAPGYYEDKKGEPFVGKAGGLLDKMLQGVCIEPNAVFICNVIKCRPPENRDPKLEEIAACHGFLTRQIDLVNPKCILALGRFAGQFLLSASLSLQNMREKVHYFKSKPVIVTYHPAYLLRNPQDKGKAYRDLLKISAFL